jgi:inosine-uridine nucleoside N-ribohydrolase
MDVETGVDDCIALLYAVASPNVDLVAATCCAGNVQRRGASATRSDHARCNMSSP